MELAKITSKGQVEALLEVQDAFRGVADELGLNDELDVVDMVKEVRAERSGGYLYK